VFLDSPSLNRADPGDMDEPPGGIVLVAAPGDGVEPGVVVEVADRDGVDVVDLEVEGVDVVDVEDEERDLPGCLMVVAVY